MNRSAAVVRHQSANALLEQGSTTRFSAASGVPAASAQCRPLATTCVAAAGAKCATSHTAGLSKLFEVLPQIGIALVISVIVALLLRLVTTAWRGMTVGFAAAVVGAGVA